MYKHVYVYYHRKFRSLNSVQWKIRAKGKCGQSQQYVLTTTHHHNHTSPQQYITTTIHHHNNTSSHNTSPQQNIMTTIRPHNNTSSQQYIITTTHHHNNTSSQQYIYHNNTSSQQYVITTTHHHNNTSSQQSFFWTVDFQIMCRATCDCMDSLLPAAFEVWAAAVVPCTTSERHVDSIPNSCLPTYVYILAIIDFTGVYIYTYVTCVCVCVLVFVRTRHRRRNGSIAASTYCGCFARSVRA